MLMLMLRRRGSRGGARCVGEGLNRDGDGVRVQSSLCKVLLKRRTWSAEGTGSEGTVTSCHACTRYRYIGLQFCNEVPCNQRHLKGRTP